MNNKSLKRAYHNLYKESVINETNKTNPVQLSPSLSKDALSGASDSTSRASAGSWSFTLANELNFSKSSGVGSFFNNSNIKFELNTEANKKMSNKDIMTLQNVIFLRILWESTGKSTARRNANSGTKSFSDTDSVLNSFNAGQFGEVSEQFLKALLGAKDIKTVDLNNVLAAGNTEFADIYSDLHGCSWSCKMAQSITAQYIDFFKIHKAFYAQGNLSETKAGVVWLEPAGTAENSYININVYGPADYQLISDRRNSMINDVNAVINTLTFTQNDKTVITNKSMYKDLQSEILKYNITNNSSPEEKKDQTKLNKKALDEAHKSILKELIRIENKSNESIEEDKDKVWTYKNMTVNIFSKMMMERDVEANIQQDKKPPKSSLTSSELKHFFGSHVIHKIEIPSPDNINKCILNIIKRSDNIKGKLPDNIQRDLENTDWLNNIISSLMHRNQDIGPGLLSIFPFLKTYSQSEISKAQKSANYWANYSKGLEGEEKDAMLRFRSGWNDLRDVVDNTLDDAENKKDVKNKALKLNLIGSLLGQNAKDLDSIDMDMNKKIDFKKINMKKLERELSRSNISSKDIWDNYEDILKSEEDLEEEERDTLDSLRKRVEKELKAAKESNESINKRNKYSLKSIIGEGRYHMMHPYEFNKDSNLKLSDIITLIHNLAHTPDPSEEVESKVDLFKEKTDGQNIWFSFSNGSPIFAYNENEIKEGGVSLDTLEEPLPDPEFNDKGKQINKPKGLHSIIRSRDKEGNPSHGGHTSFNDGIRIIDRALKTAYKSYPSVINSVFEEGDCFVSCEIIHKKGPNQILYGDNFIAPHYVENIKSKDRPKEKYDDLIKIFRFEMDKQSNPGQFSVITKKQLSQVSDSVISGFNSDKEKIEYIQKMIDHYENRIQKIIDNTSLNRDSTLTDFYKLQLLNRANSLGVNLSELSEEALLSLIGFANGGSAKELDIETLIPDYKKLAKTLKLNNKSERSKFKSEFMGPIVELFFDLGIDLTRGMKTTISHSDKVDSNHERIVETNLYNVKKALMICKTANERLKSKEEDGSLDSVLDKDLILLCKVANIQVPKIKGAISRFKDRYGKDSREEALKEILSFSIEGLIFYKQSSLSDVELEYKLTGFFAPMNQLLNRIRFSQAGLDFIDYFREGDDGKIFSFDHSNKVDVSNISSLLERKNMYSKFLFEMYNLTHYDEIPDGHFDVSFIPMSAKPFHKGHLDLVQRACRKTKDKVYVCLSISDRIRHGQNPIYGSDMEDILLKSNQSSLTRDLQTLINKDEVCLGKAQIVPSTKPAMDILYTLIDPSEFYLQQGINYGIFVGDESDASPYEVEKLNHMGGNLSVVYHDERLVSGTDMRRSLRGIYGIKEPVGVYKSGKKEGEPKIGTSLYHNEDESNFEDFKLSLPDFYTDVEKRRIWEKLSSTSKVILDSIANKLLKDDNMDKSLKHLKTSGIFLKRELKTITGIGGIDAIKRYVEKYYKVNQNDIENSKSLNDLYYNSK